MTEPSKAQTIDGELPRHCAFTLPGVVLALGRDNWYCLKDTYDVLSTDMQVCSLKLLHNIQNKNYSGGFSRPFFKTDKPSTLSHRIASN